MKIWISRALGAAVLATGLALIVPASGVSAATARCGESYTVQPGDVLWRLSMEHHTNIWAVSQVNHIPNPNLIYVDQCLVFPNQLDDPDPDDSNVASSAATPAAATPKPATTTTTRAAGGSVSVAPPQPQAGNTRALLTQAANDHGVAPALVMAIAWHESGWDQNARGRSGEIGLMQILPGTGAMLNAAHGTSYDIWTTSGNAELGAMFLRDLLNTEHGCLTCAISAYNEGPGNFAAHGYLNWQSYVAPVLALMRDY